MRRRFAAFCVAALLGLIVAAPAVAADAAMSRTTVVRAAPVLPYARSERAQAVWAERACWSGCGSYCAWGLVGCLAHDPQGRCLKLTDKCDRYCQRDCRLSGGPLVPDIFDF